MKVISTDKASPTANCISKSDMASYVLTISLSFYLHIVLLQSKGNMFSNPIQVFLYRLSASKTFILS